MAQLYAREQKTADPLEETVSVSMRRLIAARTGVDMERYLSGLPDQHNIGQPVSDRPTTRSHTSLRYRNLRWWTAAAALILLAGGIWFYRTGLPAPSAIAGSHPLNRDAAPGGNRAILTMADGSTILLDSAATGQLALQGHTKVLKLNSGLLVYNSIDPSHPANSTSPAANNSADRGSLVYNTITTPRGGQYQVLLPDGTKVWLNAASSLKFPTAFTGKERTVELTGEAYFEVAANAHLPFMVQANEGMKVQVLGTHFNLNAYRDEPMAKTTLLEGSIRISNGTDTHLLTPGQQAVLNNNSSGIQVSNDADLDEAVAWKNGMFIFNSLPLEAIMRQMERWYDVEVSYEGNIKNVSFNGQISRYSNASKMLDMLATTGEVHFKIENKKIIVRP